jgi:hypothetical protein
LRIGSIYAYEYPGSGRDVYVGSTQDGDTMRRHREHLREKKSVGPWLRWYEPEETPRPRNIELVEYENVSELLKRETFWQEKLGTFRAQGGLNKVPAWPAADKSIIGKIGAANQSIEDKSKAGKIGGKVTHQSHPDLASESGKIGGCKGIRRLRELYPDKLQEWAIKGGKNGGVLGGIRTNELHPDHGCWLGSTHGRRGMHNRWHLSRGIVNPNCEFCNVKS